MSVVIWTLISRRQKSMKNYPVGKEINQNQYKIILSFCRRESTSVESVDRFLAVALKTALYKEETGTNLFKIEDLKETVSKLNCK